MMVQGSNLALLIIVEREL